MTRQTPDIPPYRRWSVHGRSRETGAVAIESALVLPFLIIFLLVAVSIGIALYNKAIMTQAAREAARTATVYKQPLASDQQIINQALSYVSNRLVSFGAPTQPQVQLSYPDGKLPGKTITVSIHYQYQPVISVWLSASQLGAAATMTFE